jgi:molecular chaperone GrpE
MQGESSRTNGPPEAEAIVDQGAAEAPDPTEETVPGVRPPVEEAGDPLAQAQEEAARHKDAWLRTAADFDNFRKRTRRELEDARRGGREDLLRALLPVFDNLERALQSAQRSSDVKAMADGLKMVERQFVEALGREGISRIATVGHPFDPGLHEAIQQVETADHEPGTVLAEVQPGYTQGDRLLRAAMVVVAKPKADGGTAAS